MCGICGFIGNGNYEVLKRMTDTMTHRGPDESGYYFNNGIGIGHRRLIILDLVSGQQPMFNADKSLAITYNGEIYNFYKIKKELQKLGYNFKTNCDTEVVLCAYEKWGADCLQKFNGMFAFGIIHINEKKVFLARDRFGQKPLYYYLKNNMFMFGSELSCFKYHPEFEKNISIDSLQKYLFYEYIPAPHSIFENTYKLEAGHYAIYQDNKISSHKYYDSTFDISKTRNMTDIEIENEFLNKLRTSIKSRLISDVPLGIFLSGGIDSSAMTSILCEMMEPEKIKTFSIGFQEKSFDESSYARQVAEYLGTDHYEDILTAKKMQDIIPEVFSKFDEPMADNSIIPTYLLSKFTRKKVTVALGGDGGDEFLAGYDPFLAHYLLRDFKIFKHLRNFLNVLVSKIVPVSYENMSLDFKLKSILKGLSYTSELRNEFWMSSFTPEVQQKLFRDKSIVAEYKILKSVTELNFKKKNLLQKIIYLYSKLYLHGHILTKVDRASMMNSLEVRAPYLDFNFVNFVNDLPDKFKLRYFRRKYILKKVMENKLPKNILNRPKKGFGIPIAEWFKTDLRYMLLDSLEKLTNNDNDIFNKNYIKKIIDEHLNNRKNNYKELWTLFVFSIYKNK